MIKNSLMKFIDSCVGNIARKIEDEFKESDHPRGKDGKFTSRGGEGKGGSSEPDVAGHFYSSKQIGKEVKEDLKEKYSKAHGGEVLPETETEKSAKEELNEENAGKETDAIVEEFKGSGIDMYSALEDLGLDVKHTPEAYLQDTFKEALYNSPRFRQRAKQYISEYRGVDPDEEED